MAGKKPKTSTTTTTSDRVFDFPTHHSHEFKWYIKSATYSGNPDVTISMPQTDHSYPAGTINASGTLWDGGAALTVYMANASGGGPIFPQNPVSYPHTAGTQVNWTATFSITAPSGTEFIITADATLGTSSTGASNFFTIS
jgi:hypothetical protein